MATPRLRAPAIAGAALAAGLLLRAAVRTLRELREHRRIDEQLETRWVSIDGIAGPSPLRIRARVAGSAHPNAPIVLVHGFGVSSAYYVPLISILGEHRRVYAPDLPGHGASDSDARPLSTGELTLALGRWMDAAGVRDAVLVGHSLGCQFVVGLARRRPDLARRLVLVGPVCDPSAGTAIELLARAAVTLPFERPSFLILGMKDFLQAGVWVLGREFSGMLSCRLEAELRAIDAPVHVVRGSRDRISPQAWAVALARAAAAPSPSIVPHSGHAANYDAPASVAREVMREEPSPSLAEPAPPSTCS